MSNGHPLGVHDYDCFDWPSDEALDFINDFVCNEIRFNETYKQERFETPEARGM
jgi:hypothetical protein